MATQHSQPDARMDEELPIGDSISAGIDKAHDPRLGKDTVGNDGSTSLSSASSITGVDDLLRDNLAILSVKDAVNSILTVKQVSWQF